MGRRYFFLLVVSLVSSNVHTPYENGTTPPGIEYKKETGVSFRDMRTFWSTIREIVRPDQVILHLLHCVVS